MAILGVAVLVELNVLLFFGLMQFNIAIGLILPLFYIMAIPAFMTCYAAYPVIRKYMIDPYYDENGNPLNKDGQPEENATPEFQEEDSEDLSDPPDAPTAEKPDTIKRIQKTPPGDGRCRRGRGVVFHGNLTSTFCLPVGSGCMHDIQSQHPIHDFPVRIHEHHANGFQRPEEHQKIAQDIFSARAHFFRHEIDHLQSEYAFAKTPAGIILKQ